MDLVVGGDVCAPVALEPRDRLLRRQFEVLVHLRLHRRQLPVLGIDAVQDRRDVVGVGQPACLRVGELGLRDWWRVVQRELASGVLLGIFLAAIGLLRVTAWQMLFHSYGDHFVRVALTVSLSLVGVVTMGTLTGAVLPLVLRALRFDPASASAPFVATLVDVTGILIYFTVALMVLRGTML